MINLYISYTLGPQWRKWNTYFPLSNCLFGSVKLTKSADLDRCKYTGYSIGFDSCSKFWFPDGSNGSKGKDILIPGEGPTQGLDDTTLRAEAKYLINFTQSGKRLY